MNLYFYSFDGKWFFYDVENMVVFCCEYVFVDVFILYVIYDYDGDW